MTNYRSAVGAQQPSTLVLDGISIPHTDSGGSGLVVICTAGDGARDFEDLSRRLSPQYRVIALDFPNQGNSDPDSQPASATRYTQILAQCIDKLHLPGVVSLGNSIGSRFHPLRQPASRTRQGYCGVTPAPCLLPGSPGLGQRRLRCSPKTQRTIVPGISESPPGGL